MPAFLSIMLMASRRYCKALRYSACWKYASSIARSNVTCVVSFLYGHAFIFSMCPSNSGNCSLGESLEESRTYRMRFHKISWSGHCPRRNDVSKMKLTVRNADRFIAGLEINEIHMIIPGIHGISRRNVNSHLARHVSGTSYILL